jgi:hypothetical protein
VHGLRLRLAIVSAVFLAALVALELNPQGSLGAAASHPDSERARGSSSLPHLEFNGIGLVHFGLSKAQVVASLRMSLGAPNAEGINTGCGPKFSEVAWHDLIAEFRLGRFTGYRFIQGGWPLTTAGSPDDPVTAKPPTPDLTSALGITLGSTLGELRSAYSKLKLSGAVQWTAPNGLTFVEPSTVRNPRSPADKIVEIKTRTCGDF